MMVAKMCVSFCLCLFALFFSNQQHCSKRNTSQSKCSKKNNFMYTNKISIIYLNVSSENDLFCKMCVFNRIAVIE